MTVFGDRLASSIRIKWKFAPSRRRIRKARSAAVSLFFVLLTILVVAWILDSLGSPTTSLPRPAVPHQHSPQK